MWSPNVYPDTPPLYYDLAKQLSEPMPELKVNVASKVPSGAQVARCKSVQREFSALVDDVLFLGAICEDPTSTYKDVVNYRLTLDGLKCFLKGYFSFGDILVTDSGSVLICDIDAPALVRGEFRHIQESSFTPEMMVVKKTAFSA